MGGRRVGAWAAAGRTHVSMREKEGLVVCHEAERAIEKRGTLWTEQKKKGKERKKRKEGREGRDGEREREKGKINDEARGVKTVEKRKIMRTFLYIRVWERTYGISWKGREKRRKERERVESSILSRLGIKGVLYDAVVYGRGFYLIALPPVRISQ